MPNKLIDIINITKSYDENVILDQLNLYIRENEFLTLLGPSGCERLPCSGFSEDLRLPIPVISFLMEKYQQSAAKPQTVKYCISEICTFFPYVHR